MWVAPFGYPRINACLPLPGAFRSLPRPSSASGAKAFPLRPFLLNLLTVIMWVLFSKEVNCIFSLHKIVVFLPENRKTYCSHLKYFFVLLCCFCASLHCSVFKVHLRASQAFCFRFLPFALTPLWCLVGSNGLEPSTSRLSGARSNRLSYEPIRGFVGFCPLSP